MTKKSKSGLITLVAVIDNNGVTIGQGHIMENNFFKITLMDNEGNELPIGNYNLAFTEPRLIVINRSIH